MKPVLGVFLESLLLIAVLLVSVMVPPGPTLLIYIAVAEFLTTYLIHCPAHYVVGTVLGIGFRRISLARTTLARSLPTRLRLLVGLFIVPTLSTDRLSRSTISSRRLSIMYASGTMASAGSAFVFVAYATLNLSAQAQLVAWVVALGYLLFDVVFSPRTGDIMRARRALASP